MVPIVNPMNDPFDLLTPDELLRADNQVKMLKLELEYNRQLEPFSEDVSPEFVSDFLDSLVAQEEMQKDSRLLSVYEILGKPPFTPEIILTDSEVMPALNTLLQQMSKRGITLEILAPEDYTSRTIYHFVTTELFAYKTPFSGDSIEKFVYEEFYPNYRYDIVKQSNAFLKGLAEGKFEPLNRSLADQFLDRQTVPYYSVSVRPDVCGHLNRLVESWWPRTLRAGSVTNVLISHDTETAQASLMLHLNVEGDPKHILKEGIIYLTRFDLWWMIERVVVDDWVLE